MRFDRCLRRGTRLARLIAALLVGGLGAAALCAPLPPAARAEVDTLLARLQASGCEFNRNGTWYGGAEAKAHLLKKLDYLEGKGLVQSADQFIERGATGSSMSGTPYQVRCPNRPVMPSAAWLTQELKAQRADQAARSGSKG